MRLALAPIVEQLRHAGLARVEGVLEFSAQTAEPRQLPAFFVVPTDEAAGGNGVNVGARDQVVDVGFSVFVVTDASRRNVAGIADDLGVHIGSVMDALTGWTHPAASRACDYAGGNLGSAGTSAVVWRVRFKMRYHLRKTS